MRQSRDNATLIIVADDHADTREMYGGYLAQQGFRVVEARDGVEAVRLTKDLRPAVVVLDLEMPRVHGLTVIQRIRADAELQEMQILVLTAYDHLEQDALTAGANAVCVKPCAPDALVKQILRLLGPNRP